ncbi:MAG TPA: hypothetical protein VHG10_13450 [Glycomyces sp.]|nr:hypothetical protein [Glycomyces sp.]
MTERTISWRMPGSRIDRITMSPIQTCAFVGGANWAMPLRASASSISIWLTESK